MSDRESVARRMLDGLSDFTERLHLAGGEIHATGLRVTTVRQCPYCMFDDKDRTVCDPCDSTGWIRTVNDGTGKSN